MTRPDAIILVESNSRGRPYGQAAERNDKFNEGDPLDALPSGVIPPHGRIFVVRISGLHASAPSTHGASAPPSDPWRTEALDIQAVNSGWQVACRTKATLVLEGVHASPVAVLEGEDWTARLRGAHGRTQGMKASRD